MGQLGLLEQGSQGQQGWAGGHRPETKAVRRAPRRPGQAAYIPGRALPAAEARQMALQVGEKGPPSPCAPSPACHGFEAFCAGGLAPGWSLLVRAYSDAGEDRFEINFLSETGDIAFHIKPRFSSVTMVGNAFQGGRWGQEEVSSIFPLVLGEPFEMEVSSDSGHFHVHAQEHKVLQFAHRHRPLTDITRVQGWGPLSCARSPGASWHQTSHVQWRPPWKSWWGVAVLGHPIHLQ
ncbi:grifin isoform X1 [Manis javanica]|uniref:grifin isoform X1 n=1 Tax=Manis javanica TaxID=9974 RepID=UPI00187A71BA|nr:grifin isoform X2 [Manis javanica]